MPNPNVFDEYLLLSVPEDDATERKRKPLEVSLEGLEEVSGLSAEALAILAFMVAAVNRYGCLVALDLDCPLFSRHATARQELRHKDLLSEHSVGDSVHLFFTEAFQRLLSPDLGLTVHTYPDTTVRPSPAPHVE